MKKKLQKVEYIREGDMSEQTAEVPEEMLDILLKMKKEYTPDEKWWASETNSKEKYFNNPPINFIIRNDDGTAAYRVRLERMMNDYGGEEGLSEEPGSRGYLNG